MDKQIEEVEITQKAIRKSADSEGTMVDLLNQEMKELQESQKQIEEMSSYLIGKNVTGSDSTKVLSLDYLTVKEIASILVNAGYRKIPEIPKNTVLTNNDIAELLSIVARDTRKKTAKKFAERLREAVACIPWCETRHVYEAIDEILKEIVEELTPKSQELTEKCQKEEK